MEKYVEIEAAEALLDVGVSLPLFSYKVPWCKRGTARLTMRRPCLGTQIRIARLYLKLGVTHEEMKGFNKHEELAFLARHGKTLSLMVALTVCRGPLSGLFAGLLAWTVRWLVPDAFLLAANHCFVRLLGTKSFMPIIESTQAANPLSVRESQKGRKGS